MKQIHENVVIHAYNYNGASIIMRVT